MDVKHLVGLINAYRNANMLYLSLWWEMFSKRIVSEHDNALFRQVIHSINPLYPSAEAHKKMGACLLYLQFSTDAMINLVN